MPPTTSLAAPSIIRAIAPRAGHRWSLGDLTSATGYTRPTVKHILDNLQRLKLVRHVPEVRGYRRWEAAPAWFKRPIDDIIADYEWAARSHYFSPAEKGVTLASSDLTPIILWKPNDLERDPLVPLIGRRRAPRLRPLRPPLEHLP